MQQELLVLLNLLIVASWLYWLVALYLVDAYFRVKPRVDTCFMPPVSILKPVKGLDVGAYENFASFCLQDYPDFELLFGVADPTDPVIPVVHRLQREFPQRRIRLFTIRSSGANRKASMLHGLAGQADNEVLVVSDSDMRVTPDYLADDYQLGARIADLGLRVYLSHYIVASILGATTFRDQWHREVRWARCNRVSRPREYPGLLLTFSTPLAAVLLALSGFAAMGWQALLASVCLRWLVAWLVTGYTGDLETRRWLILLPLRDMLSALVWLAAGVGWRVVWRGEAFILDNDGRMRLEPSRVVNSKAGHMPGNSHGGATVS